MEKNLAAIEGAALGGIERRGPKVRLLSHPHAIRHGRPEASAAIWSWRESTVSDAPSAGALRRRGVLKSLLPLAIGSLLYFGAGATGGLVVIGFAALLLLSAVVSPTGLYAVLERGLEALVARVMLLLQWLVLRAVFYGVFVPFGKLTRAGSGDRLQRGYEPDRESYWSKREGERVASTQRRRQY